MNNINNLIIEGHLCNDPESRSPIPGKNVCNFNIAVNRNFLRKPGSTEYLTETSYFPVVVWGEIGEMCQTYLKKGRGVRIVGRLKQETWKTGVEEYRQRVVIIAEHVEFMPGHRKPEEDSIDKEAKDLMNANANTSVNDTNPPADISESEIDKAIAEDPAFGPSDKKSEETSGEDTRTCTVPDSKDDSSDLPEPENDGEN